MTKIVETDKESDTVFATNTFWFNENERLTRKFFGAVGHTYRPVYEQNANGYVYPDNEVLGISLDGKFTDQVAKDGLRRTQHRNLSIGSQVLFDELYGYLSTPNEGKTIETEIVASVASHVYGTNANSETLNYTYDKAGNLETISRGNSLLSKYYYDGLNRLKREDNHTAGKTYVWDYDVGGNILFKKEYALCTDVNLGTCLDTKTYTYTSESWRDQLTSYNGLACEYDSMGNPTTYLGNTLTWTKVRRLASFGSHTFKYGANGIRYQKNNTVYTLDGNKILRETDGTKTITYYHGGSGIVGFEYNGTDYYFRKNMQGDVTEIYTSAGLKVASYLYDAWGKVLSVNNYTAVKIGDLNPIRYRGYYYDEEIELYYLQSRYYDAGVGRFINADKSDLVRITGSNLFSYCFNTPITHVDYCGNIPLALIAIAAIGVALFVKTFALSIAMYAYSAIGASVDNNINLSSWWNPIGNLMKNRLENSKIITNRIKQYIGKIVKGSYSNTESIYFSPKTTNVKDLDLAMSVGHASNCKITVKKRSKKWFSSKYNYSVTIELSDKYDFDLFNASEKGRIITWINNGLGYYPMKWGILKIYHWSIKHTFNFVY